MLIHPCDKKDHCVACGKSEPYPNRSNIGNDLVLETCHECMQALAVKARAWLDAARKAQGLPPLDWKP